MFESAIHTGMLSFGLTHLRHSYAAPNFVTIQGKLVLRGSGLHAFGPGGTLAVGKTGVLEIGDNFTVGHHNRFVIRNHSVIGNNNLHSWDNLYMDTDSHPIYDENGCHINPSRGFTIGDNVWIGAKCTILKGSNIAAGCVIATGSLINKSLCTPKAIYAGSRLLKDNVSWKNVII